MFAGQQHHLAAHCNQPSPFATPKKQYPTPALTHVTAVEVRLWGRLASQWRGPKPLNCATDYFPHCLLEFHNSAAPIPAFFSENHYNQGVLTPVGSGVTPCSCFIEGVQHHMKSAFASKCQAPDLLSYLYGNDEANKPQMLVRFKKTNFHFWLSPSGVTIAAAAAAAAAALVAIAGLACAGLA
eukprot:877596-Pelagomonas_calceolata.AAC.1